MTPEIITVLSILAIAVILFITEWVRMDVVALMVMGSLALTGLVSTSDALSGFSSPAVVTVWAVLILSGGLARTGVAGLIGKRLLRFLRQHPRNVDNTPGQCRKLRCRLGRQA